jgi:probable HAF family extracellular repeat protein
VAWHAWGQFERGAGRLCGRLCGSRLVVRTIFQLPASLPLDGANGDARHQQDWNSGRYGIWRFCRWLCGGWENGHGWIQPRLRWTPTDGMQDIDGRRLGYSSHAFDVSADGSVVVGEVYSGWFWHAFRWTAANWMQALGTLGGSDSRAYGVSADGSVVVGSAQVSPPGVRAFRWTAETGMQNLGAPEGASSAAYSVSAGGSVVVGSIISPSYRRTPSDGRQRRECKTLAPCQDAM